MRKIIAKFNSACPRTGLAIRKGTICHYDPDTRTAYHPTASLPTKGDDTALSGFIQAQEDAYFDSFCHSQNI
jgi:hypothetical protein